MPEQHVRFPDRPEYVALPTEERGFHWHFFVSSQRHWWEKFCKHLAEPEVWFCGTPVELPKRCWQRAVGRLSEDELAGYFDRWIARPEEELLRLAGEGLVSESGGVEAVLREAGALAGDRLLLPRGRWWPRKRARPIRLEGQQPPAVRPAAGPQIPAVELRQLDTASWSRAEERRLGVPLFEIGFEHQ